MARMQARWIYFDTNTLEDDGSGNLRVKRKPSGGISADSTGLYVAPGAITDAMLAEDYLLLTGGNLSGSIDMGSNKITGLSSPSTSGDAAEYDWVLSQLAAAGQAAEWQDSVLDRFDPSVALPVGPSDGDRYLASATGNGWTSNYIYEWDNVNTQWVESIPTTGTYVSVDDESDGIYYFGGISWTKKYFESNSAGDGIDINSYVVSVDVTDLLGNGISEDGSNNLVVNPDTTGGTNLATVVNVSSNGVAIKIDDATIKENGSNQLYAVTKTSGGLSSDSSGLFVDYDNSTIGIKTGKLAVLDGGIDTLQLALDSVDNTILDLTNIYDFATAGGTIKVTTQSANDNSTNAASTAYVDSAISAATGSTVERFTLSGTDISNKYVTLSSTPNASARVLLEVKGAPTQYYGDDYTVSGTQVSWNTLGLDGILISGDKLTISFDS